jgi:flagellar biosynthesis/type III secretory pathway protein FliH
VLLPDGGEDDFGSSVEKDRQTERIPPYVNPANAALIEQHFDEIRKIMNPQ